MENGRNPRDRKSSQSDCPRRGQIAQHPERLVKLEKPCGHDGSEKSRQQRMPAAAVGGSRAPRTSLNERARTEDSGRNDYNDSPACRQTIRGVMTGKTGVFNRTGIQRFTPTTGKSRNLILESASIRIVAARLRSTAASGRRRQGFWHAAALGPPRPACLPKHSNGLCFAP